MNGGLYRSADRGITWTSCNNGLVISEFEYLAQDFGASRWVIGGTQDNGTERWTGSPVWTHVADGDGGDCAVNRATPATCFHTYFGMSPERSTTGGDFGSWAWLPPPVPAGESSLFYPPFEASANGGDTVAIGGDALYVSRNNATTWVRLGFPAAARSSALSPACPKGGWPRSWARASASVRSSSTWSVRAIERATCDTSRLWVSLVR